MIHFHAYFAPDRLCLFKGKLEFTDSKKQIHGIYFATELSQERWNK